MIEGILIFVCGFLCGKYTDQIKMYIVKLVNKFKKNDNEEIITD